METLIIGTLVAFFSSLLGVLGWMVKSTITSQRELEKTTSKNSERITSLETTFSVLGDIGSTLQDIKVQVAVLQAGIIALQKEFDKK